ncbi:GAF domain-containing protein [Nocardioides sp.]|uniref:GAF domain-containing protein n=1 Tax=Nocardioides sp. TaxID=35761 RepID=UPI00321BEC56
MDQDSLGGPAPLGQVELDDLLREVLVRVEGALDEKERLRLLLDAVVTMAADLSLDGVLARIVAIAGALVDARYAALGVLGGGADRRLRTFIHHGIGDEQAAVIGDLPTGHGLLGLIIDRPETLRLHDIAEHPSSYGFPAEHPQMHSFLGVPIRTRGRVFGNLYLTEKSGASDFTAQDEEIVVALAAAAGVVIENARLYEETQRRERWLVTTAAITSQVAASSNYEDVLTEVADRARAAASADEAWVLSGSKPGEVVASSGSPVGVPAWLAEASAGSAGASAALDPCPWLRVPLGGDRVGQPLTLVLAWSTERQDAFDEVDQSLAESFAEQVALAIEVSQRREVDERMAVLEDRDRIGRDLHDLVIQRLFAVGLGLESTA